VEGWLAALLGPRISEVVEDMGIQVGGKVAKPTCPPYKPPYLAHDSNLMEPSHVRDHESAICAQFAFRFSALAPAF
jgi:hypothetical protein